MKDLDPADEGTGTKRDELDVMVLSLAVVRKLITREEARTAVLRSGDTAAAARSLGLSQELSKEAAALARLPARERSECLEIFKDLFPLTRELAERPTLIEEGGAAPPASPAAPLAPGHRFGRYILQEELGRGGMGVVYKARDPEAGRTIALKLMLRADDPVEVRRFEREARTAIGLDHPNIVKVYEVGVHQNLPFIAMEFLPGRSLSSILDPHRPREERATLERAVGLIRDAALALGHAHERKVVHRDVKPQNIIVDDAGRVCVMDFGLAREMKRGLTVTSTGSVIGTPQYMSPEQAMGERERIGPRTDVWALGVMLYEVAARSAPFEGDTSAEVLHKVTHEDAVPVRKRNPAIARDLETVIMKCLEPEPADRYATGTKLAEDLGRYLDGVPITARPPSVFKRLRRKAARRKGILLAAAAGVAAVALVTGVLLPKLGSARHEADAANRAALEARKAVLDQLRQTTEAALSAALGFRQQGRLDEMGRYLKQTEEACRKAATELPDEAEPHYRLGRMHRALMKDEDALREQEKALALDPEYAPARYERVILNARRYRARVTQLETEARRDTGRRLAAMGGGEVKAGAGLETPKSADLASRDAKASALRAKLEEDLKAIETSKSMLERAQAQCARGLLQWATGDNLRALGTLLPLVEAKTPLEEAYEAVGSIEFWMGRFAESEKCWTAGIERDRGYVPFVGERGQTRAIWAHDPKTSAEESEKLWKGAAEDYQEVARRNPDRAQAWYDVAITQANWGRKSELRGGDPEPHYAAALPAYEEALKLDPSDDRIWTSRGSLKFNRAATLQEKGEPFEGLLLEAEADFEQALKRNPENAGAWCMKGFGKALRGMALGKRNDGTVAFYRSALSDLNEALKRTPDDLELWWLRVMARLAVADTLKEHKGDPRDEYRSAIEGLGEVIRRSEKKAEPLFVRGDTQLLWGNANVGKREDPAEHYRAAIEDFGKCLELDSANARAWRYRGAVRYYWARWMIETAPNLEVLDEVRAARDDLETAVRLMPSLAPSVRDSLQDCRGYIKQKGGE